jgi:hypothetical protein
VTERRQVGWWNEDVRDFIDVDDPELVGRADEFPEWRPVYVVEVTRD